MLATLDPTQLKFDSAGLIPAIVQDADTGEILMMAWMNAESIGKTIETRTTWFWSRVPPGVLEQGRDLGQHAARQRGAGRLRRRRPAGEGEAGRARLPHRRAHLLLPRPVLTSQFHPTRERFDELTTKHNVVPVWTEVVADLETPVSLYMKLVQGAADDSVSFLLESVEHGQRWGRYSFVGVDPFLVVTSRDGKVSVDGNTFGDIDAATPLESVRKILNAFSAPVIPELPPLIAGGVGLPGVRRGAVPGEAAADHRSPTCRLPS